MAAFFTDRERGLKIQVLPPKLGKNEEGENTGKKESLENSLLFQLKHSVQKMAV